MKAILLARVSSKEQQEGMSIPAQERRMQEYAARKGLEIARSFSITESSTRGARKKFQEIIQTIKKSKHPIALIADTVDRIQRGYKESEVLSELIKSGKLVIHFIREGLILNSRSNSSDIMRWDFSVMVAKQYVLQMSDNIVRAKEQAAKAGIWMGRAPVGYINTVNQLGKKTILPDPDLAHFVSKMFELYAKGTYSLSRLQKEISDMGARTKKGKQFAISQINKILKNRFYCGIMDSKYGVVEHQYESLTSPATFRKVQEIIEGYHSKPHKTRAKPFILKGMITCSDCGCLVTPEIKKGRYIYYSCTNGKKICKRHYVPENKLLMPLMEYFDHITLSEEQINTIVNNLQTSYASEAKFQKNSMNTLSRESEKIQRRLSQIYDDKLDGLIDEAMYLEKVKEYRARQAEILGEMKQYETGNQKAHITAESVLNLAARARELFESSEVDEKRQLLNFVFQNLQLKDLSLSVQVNKPFDMVMDFKHRPDNWRWRESNSRPWQTP